MARLSLWKLNTDLTEVKYLPVYSLRMWRIHAVECHESYSFTCLPSNPESRRSQAEPHTVHETVERLTSELFR
jgi:hypothetical protein